MNQIKITFLSLIVCFAISDLAAQDTKPSSSKETKVNPIDVANQKAKSNSAEMTAALKISDEKRIFNIMNVIKEYEVALSKAMDSDKTAEHKAKAKELLERDRDKRLSVLLDQSELKLYTKWKESKEEAEEAVLENEPKKLMEKGSKAAVKK